MNSCPDWRLNLAKAPFGLGWLLRLRENKSLLEPGNQPAEHHLLLPHLVACPILPQQVRFPNLGEASFKKKLVFFGENLKGGCGGLAESKISVNRKKLRIFWIFCQKGGGLTQSKRVLSEKMRFLGIFCQKVVILSEKNSEFFGIFGHQGGRSPPIQNFC